MAGDPTCTHITSSVSLDLSPVGTSLDGKNERLLQSSHLRGEEVRRQLLLVLLQLLLLLLLLLQVQLLG